MHNISFDYANQLVLILELLFTTQNTHVDYMASM